MENKNWKHANQIAAGAWDVEHVHELNKLPTPHTYIFSSFEVAKGKRQSAWDVVILHKYDTPAPTITFSGVLR